ncbi:MAG: glycine--tRNA ligase subunit beta [Pseudomonadota bacterium]
MPDLLIELFSEEIPARMQARASADLKRLVTEGLVQAGLTYAGAEAFATPRRLTLAVSGLTAESPTVREERKGPRADAPAKAVEGFLRSTGLARSDLEERETPKGAVLFAVVQKPGRVAEEIVSEVLDGVIRGFPWPKSMRWAGAGLPGNGRLRWVRPLRRILCLLSDETGARVVPLEVEGIAADDLTEGHRFMAPAAFSVSGFEDYSAKLKHAHVVLDPDERADAIWHDASTQAFALGLELVEDRGLLAEVAGLVEWPVVLIGEIGEAFLGLPPEVLRTSMKEHQKFFALLDPKTGRIVRFVTVANRETEDHGATILAGNHKVLAARLSDAKFFWENDLRVVSQHGMEAMAAPLANVTFERRLGSQQDRIARIGQLAREIAPVVGADLDAVATAAVVCKADLASEMVYEFPELQGVMGRYYAEAAGLAPQIAAACEDHYKPAGPSDEVPAGAVSRAVALADKIDTLTGFWAIDEKPTGSKDPFALRRAALGVIRIVLETDEPMPLLRFFSEGFALHPGEAAAQDLLGFFHDRLKVHLRDEGIRHDVIDAVLSDTADDLARVTAQARALQAVLATEDGENLIQGFKRANNILRQAEEKDGVAYEYGPDPKFAEIDEERALFAALDAAEATIGPALASQDFAGAMAAMAALRAPIDAFFEAVQVNAENQIVRRNRLNLLHRITAICGQLADLTKVEG